MSLFTFLKQSDVKESFKEEFATLPFQVKMEILAPPIIPSHANLIGTAFDYLLRFYIEALNKNKTQSHGWVAELSLPLIVKNEGAGETHDNALRIIQTARKHHNSFLSTRQITDELLEDVLLLAQLDLFHRAGFVIASNAFRSIDKSDIQDLQNLYALIKPEMFKVKNGCYLNPTFGELSSLIGGADADVVLDNTLIDIKTVKELKLQREYFNELIGYFCLNSLYQLSGIPDIPILSQLGVYFSRYGYMHIISIKDIVNPKTFPTFLKWFKERAAHHGSTGQ